MKTEEICIRDPFVMPYNGKYYLYGTRSHTTWGKADGFDCYTSDDLADWEGPYEIFKRPEGFWADQNYWAPECYEHNGRFYLVTTLGAEDRKKAVYVMISDSPRGPFKMLSDNPLTPADWTAIDGALHFEEDGTPYLVFSHTFEDKPEGDMCAIELKDDLSSSVGEPVFLFSAEQSPWARPVPFAKQEFNMDGDVYFTDGPCTHRGRDGRLYMIWSSWIIKGYGVGVAFSDSGAIYGPWRHDPEPLFPENGGHGMVFKGFDGRLIYTLHYPNDFTKERPIFRELNEANGKLALS